MHKKILLPNLKKKCPFAAHSRQHELFLSNISMCRRGFLLTNLNFLSVVFFRKCIRHVNQYRSGNRPSSQNSILRTLKISSMSAWECTLHSKKNKPAICHGNTATTREEFMFRFFLICIARQGDFGTEEARWLMQAKMPFRLKL